MMNKIVQNKKLMIVILSSVVLIIAAVSVLLILKNKNKLTATTMRLMEMQGIVTLESGGKIKEVIDNLKLNSGDILSTASESFVSISLDDYKMVKIQENSRAEFIQNGKELALNLVEGSLFFDVSKKLDADETFQISTSTMVVGIRGTSGYVFVEEDGADGILITDGVVDITGINPQTGETKKTTGKAGQVVHVYIIDDDDNTVQFDLENVKEEDLPPEVVEFLVEHPDLMDRVCEVTNWDKEKIIARYEALKAPQEPEQEDKEEEKKPENEKEQEPPEAEEPPPQDPPKQEDPPADPPGNTDDTVTDPAPIDPPAEEKQEETNNNDDSGDDDDDDEDDEDDTPILVSQLVMMSGEASVDVGSTISLSCGISPSNATNKTLSWSTSNASVATVSSSGVVTGVSAGSAIITATTCDGSGKSAGCMVSVDAPAEYYVQGVSISGPSQVNAGGSVNLTAVIDPSDAESGATISWSSSNESVATVSSTGTVTAVGLTGSTQITVTAQTTGHPVQSASKTVTVIAAPVESGFVFYQSGPDRLTSYTDVIQVSIAFDCENYVSGTLSYEIDIPADAHLAISEQPSLAQQSDGKWMATFPVQLNDPSLSGVNEEYTLTVYTTLDGSVLGTHPFHIRVLV